MRRTTSSVVRSSTPDASSRLDARWGGTSRAAQGDDQFQGPGHPEDDADPVAVQRTIVPP